tara:strand:- start:5917 stop:6168 length:252 start_codon:yes stop_codon:yes gene_type:complete
MTHHQMKCATGCINQSPLCRWCIPTGWRFPVRKCNHDWEDAIAVTKETEILKELKSKKHKSKESLRYEFWLRCVKCESFKAII